MPSNCLTMDNLNDHQVIQLGKGCVTMQSNELDAQAATGTAHVFVLRSRLVNRQRVRLDADRNEGEYYSKQS